MRQEWRAYWPLLVGVFLGLATGYGAWPYVQSLLYKPLQAEFGWDREQIAFAFSASGFLVFMAPLMGRLVDRLGVKPVLAVCMTGMGLTFIAIANSRGVYPLFVALHILLYLFGLGTTGIGFTRAVTSWFSKSLGTALALSRIGVSAVGALLPIAAFHLISQFGWQSGYYLLAGISLLIGLPVSWLLVSDRRSAAPAAAEAAGTPLTRLAGGLRTWLRLMTSWRVLLLSIAAAFTYAPCVAVLTQLHPMLTDKGVDPTLAAELSGLLAVSVLAGTLVSGFLVDRIWAPLLACLFTLGPVVGVVMLLPGQLEPAVAAGAVVLIGLAQGAEIDVVAYMTARYFGIGSYAAIYGFTVMLIGLGAAIGPILFARSHNLFDSYNPALIGAAVVFATAALCYLGLGRYPQTQPA